MNMNDRLHLGHRAQSAGRLLVAAFIIGLALLVGQPAQAAVVRVEAPVYEVPPGDEVTVALVLDGEGREFNAVEGTVNLIGDGMEIADLWTGNSDITLWVEDPVINEGRSVRFAGIIPGGRLGSARIFRLVLKGNEVGSGEVAMEGLRVLLNDGEGTEAQSRYVPVTVYVREGAPAVPEELVDKDRDPPEAFTPEIVSDPLLMDGANVLVFVTQDKGTGIARYEVYETRRELTLDEDVEWEQATSPYVLRDQALKSYIFMKAVDRVGNARFARLDPHVPLSWYERGDILAIIGAVILGIAAIGIVVLRITWRGRQKGQQKP